MRVQLATSLLALLACYALAMIAPNTMPTYRCRNTNIEAFCRISTPVMTCEPPKEVTFCLLKSTVIVEKPTLLI